PFRCPDVLLREEVAGDLHRLVGGAGVERAFVVRSDDRDGADSELAGRAEDPQGDLAAVCDEQLPDQAFLPGLSRFCGSKARLTALCSSNARGPSCLPSQFRLTNPTPCSPEIVPPSLRASSKSASERRGASASSCSSSPASRKDVWRLPSPA